MMKQDIKLKGWAPQSVFQVPHSLFSLMVWYNIDSIAIIPRRITRASAIVTQDRAL